LSTAKDLEKLFTLAKSQISTLRSQPELDTLPDFVESLKNLSSGIEVNSQPHY